MKTTVITILIIGIVLITVGVWADYHMAARGEPGDVRSITAIPIFIGYLAIFLDIVLLMGWGIWHLFRL